MRRSAMLSGLVFFFVLSSASDASAQVREQAGVNSASVPQTNAPLNQVSTSDALSTATTGARATLGPGDLIDLGVFDTPELTQRVRINSDGKITLALIGEITVTGMSPDSLRSVIAQKLIEGKFVRDPQVTLFVSEYAGQVAYVVGEVSRPGAYPLLRSHRLQDLIAISGGLNTRAGNIVTLSRGEEKPVVMTFDLSSQDESVSNPEVLPGDRINVQQAGIVYVLGEVGRPGGFLIDRYHKVTVMQSLALAEGIQSSASIKKATLLRGGDVARQEIPVNVEKILKGESPDMTVQAGDILYIYGSLTRGLGRSAIQAILATASSAAIYVEAGR